VWKLNDDLFTSTKPYDANATGNVSMSSSICMYQKNTLELAFFIVSVFFIFVCVFCFAFSEYFGVQFCCFLVVWIEYTLPHRIAVLLLCL